MSDAPSNNDTDQNEVVFTTKINGTEKAVTRAHAIRYAQQVGSMAEQAAALAKRQDDLDQWDRFVTGYERDPHGTMAQLATAAGGHYNPKGAPKGSAQPDEDGTRGGAAGEMGHARARHAPRRCGPHAGLHAGGGPETGLNRKDAKITQRRRDLRVL